MNIKNDPSKAGKRTGKMILLGEFSRFAIYPVHTRGDQVSWFVSDAEIPDEVTGLPNSIIGQFASEAAAIMYLMRRFDILGLAMVDLGR